MDANVQSAGKKEMRHIRGMDVNVQDVDNKEMKTIG
jgi:hypothetical protein